MYVTVYSPFKTRLVITTNKNGKCGLIGNTDSDMVITACKSGKYRGKKKSKKVAQCNICLSSNQ